LFSGTTKIPGIIHRLTKDIGELMKDMELNIVGSNEAEYMSWKSASKGQVK
jgi:actin-related protein